jgi:hypothetical protein
LRFTPELRQSAEPGRFQQSRLVGRQGKPLGLATPSSCAASAFDPDDRDAGERAAKHDCIPNESKKALFESSSSTD